MLQPAAEFEKELVEKVVRINRVSKVVKGGRRFSFNALAVVGDSKTQVGIGLCKANEVPTKQNTLAHEVGGAFKSTRVMLRPATPGTGIIAGEAVRAVVEQAGIHDVLSKVVGSKNVINVVRATMDALIQLETPIISARKRNITLTQLFGNDL